MRDKTVCGYCWTRLAPFARVDAQVYFKVKSDEDSVKSSIYSVNDYR